MTTMEELSLFLQSIVTLQNHHSMIITEEEFGSSPVQIAIILEIVQSQVALMTILS